LPAALALPVLVALYRSEKWNTKHGRRHKTPAMLLRQLAAVMIHWFPRGISCWRAMAATAPTRWRALPTAIAAT